MKKYICFLFAFLITILPLTGCKAKAPLIEEELYALDTLITLSIYSDNKEAIKKAKDEIKRLERLLSVTDNESDIYKINASPDTFVKVSGECFSLIKTAVEVSDVSAGNFDITVYPAVKLWGFTNSDLKVPLDSDVEAVKEKIGYNKIELDENTKSVKIPIGTELDLGGIAKGYIADKTAEVLKEQGVDSAILNFGGNIKLLGSKSDNDAFKIGIKSPYSDGYYGVVKVKDATVSTSGGYERYFEENGKRYHHIINPFTAFPAESDIVSATVIGEKGEVCDSLSTAAFVLGSSNISKLADFYSNYSFILLTDNAVYCSENIVEDFEIYDTFKDLEIKII